MLSDVCDAIRHDGVTAEEILENRSDLETRLYNEYFIRDDITGNASGSYTFNAWEAEENVGHNLDLLGEALEYFGSDPADIMKSAESCDVTIRCYLLSEVLCDALERIAIVLNLYEKPEDADMNEVITEAEEN